MKLGKARYGQGAMQKRKYFRLKDGEATFRILPPMGELADKGIWSVFYNVHFGYKTSAGKLKPFQSPLVKNRKTKMIEVPDAALERITTLKLELEKAKSSGNRAAVEKLEKLVGFKGLYSLDNNHYMNVVDSQGNIGILQIRHRAKLVLDAEIKRLRESGTDPLSVDNGRFFTFRRTGTGLDTSFSVIVAKEKLTVEGVGVVERDIVHRLDEETIARLSNEAGKLDTLFKRPTSEEVARIVNESDILTGKSRAVDEILDTKASTTDTEDYEDIEAEETPVVNMGPVTTMGATSNETVTRATPPSVTTAGSTLETKPAASVTVVSSPVENTSTKIAEMSEDEFLKSLGL